jgi:hypothetical protein
MAHARSNVLDLLFSSIFFFKKQMARPSYLLNHSPITNLVCIKYGYGKYTIIIIIIIIIIKW